MRRTGAENLYALMGALVRGVSTKIPHPQLFTPFAQSPDRGADFVVNTATTPETLIASVVRTIAAIDPSVPVYQLSTLEQRVDALLAARRFQTFLLSLFAAGGILLAAIGVYGLLRSVVMQRRQEIGIRMAMGALDGV